MSFGFWEYRWVSPFKMLMPAEFFKFLAQMYMNYLGFDNPSYDLSAYYRTLQRQNVGEIRKKKTFL
jgi:hypothetical protein